LMRAASWYPMAPTLWSEASVSGFSAARRGGSLLP
jgi:hypothetical protein